MGGIPCAGIKKIHMDSNTPDNWEDGGSGDQDAVANISKDMSSLNVEATVFVPGQNVFASSFVPGISTSGSNTGSSTPSAKTEEPVVNGSSEAMEEEAPDDWAEKADDPAGAADDT